MRPIYAFRSENEIAKDLRTLERRLRDRNQELTAF